MQSSVILKISTCSYLRTYIHVYGDNHITVCQDLPIYIKLDCGLHAGMKESIEFLDNHRCFGIMLYLSSISIFSLLCHYKKKDIYCSLYNYYIDKASVNQKIYMILKLRA